MRKFTVFVLFFVLSTVTVTIASDTTISNVVLISTEEYPPFTSEKLNYYGIMCRIVTEAFLLEDIKGVYLIPLDE